MQNELIRVAGASVASLWVATVIARPGRPLAGNEIEELVYSRLLGRQHRVALLALIVTMVTFVVFIVAIPSRVQSSTSITGEPHQASSICQLLPPCNEWEYAGYVPIYDTKTIAPTTTAPLVNNDLLEPYNGSR